MKAIHTFCFVVAILAFAVAQAGAQTGESAKTDAGAPGRASVQPPPPGPPGALSPENLAKPRPKPPFNLTGNWLYNGRMSQASGGFQYLPLPKLKPAAQALYEESQKAEAAGKAFHNDAGACWPEGMPMMMTRVWPNQTIQLPTMILMIQMLKNEIRWIYLDGRPHGDPEITPPSYAGDSIGHWEGDTLVVETTNIETNHHWVQTGVTHSDQFKIVERIRLKDNGKTMEDQYTFTDPLTWDGEWVNTKYFTRSDNTDIGEANCTPELNDRLFSTRPGSNIR